MDLPAATPIGPEFLIGLCEANAFVDSLFVNPPQGADAVQPAYLPRMLAAGLAAQGYDAAEFCADFRRSAQA